MCCRRSSSGSSNFSDEVYDLSVDSIAKSVHSTDSATHVSLLVERLGYGLEWSKLHIMFMHYCYFLRVAMLIMYACYSLPLGCPIHPTCSFATAVCLCCPQQL